MREKMMLEFQNSHRSNQASPGMRSKTPLLMSILLSASLAHALAAAESKAPASNLTAAQVVDKHVEARGGLQAWRAVQTLSMSGKSCAAFHRVATAGIELARHRQRLPGAQRLQSPARLHMLIEDLRGSECAVRRV